MRTQAAAWRDRCFVVLLLAGSGCATASHPLATDPTFQAAQSRLALTSARVRGSGANASDQALFMQAEAFYQYRYGFTHPRPLGYLAELAAAVTDFPAFQSVAGALDLGELRLRGSDGAIQLWQALLDQSPDSPLRDLTLYRLAWASRNSGLSGSNGLSPKARFEALRKIALDSDWDRLAQEAETVPWRSKSTATSLSLLPGLGQAYVGQYYSAGSRFTVALGALAMILVPVTVAFTRNQDLNWGRDWPLLAVGLGGAVVLNLDYTLSYQDALRQTLRFNEVEEANFLRQHPNAP